MNVGRRRFLYISAAAAALPTAPRIAWSQAYPSRPVRILVGFAPAGTNDIHARLVARWLSEHLGQQFIIENRPGAGGNLAAEALVRSAPDGYTLLEASAADAWNAALSSNLKFNFVRDIAPVASISRTMNVLAVHPDVPVKSLSEFISYVKDNPGKMAVASAGVGSSPHICWELFRSMSGVEMQHVPYRGGGPALTDLLAGHVQVMFATLAASQDHVKSGRLRGLAVTGTTRSNAFPDIPRIGEVVPGYEASAWQGIVAPKNTSAEVIKKLNSEINAALGDPMIQAHLDRLGSTPFVSSPADFGKFIAEFTEQWGKVIRAADIRPD